MSERVDKVPSMDWAEEVEQRPQPCRTHEQGKRTGGRRGASQAVDEGVSKLQASQEESTSHERPPPRGPRGQYASRDRGQSMRPPRGQERTRRARGGDRGYHRERLASLPHFQPPGRSQPESPGGGERSPGFDAWLEGKLHEAESPQNSARAQEQAKFKAIAHVPGFRERTLLDELESKAGGTSRSESGAMESTKRLHAIDAQTAGVPGESNSDMEHMPTDSDSDAFHEAEEDGVMIQAQLSSQQNMSEEDTVGASAKASAACTVPAPSYKVAMPKQASHEEGPSAGRPVGGQTSESIDTSTDTIIIWGSKGSLSSELIRLAKDSHLVVVTTCAEKSTGLHPVGADAAVVRILPAAVRDTVRALDQHELQLYGI